MAEPATELATVHTVITELAAIVVRARASLGAGRSGCQLEMAEMDLLSAQAAIEKACMETDLTPVPAKDVLRFLRSAAQGEESDRSAQSATMRQRRLSRRAPGQGQCELFSLPASGNKSRVPLT